MIATLMPYTSDQKLLKLPRLLLHSDDVKAISFRYHPCVNVVFGGQMRLPHAVVKGAWLFAKDQIRRDACHCVL